MEPNILASPALIFRRSAAAQAGNSLLAALGGVLFLGFALLLLLGLVTQDAASRVIGAAVFGFFGLFMAAGAVAGARRGTDTRVAEIDAFGAWLPDMGRLPWSAFTEVRLERLRGVGGGEAPVTRQMRRLGFVPRDTSLRPDAATNLGWRMAGWYFRMVKAIAPEVRLGGDDPAPFGVAESDIPHDFERLLQAVAAHTTIADAAAARAHERAARWAAPDPSAAAQLDIASLDAALGRPAGAIAATSSAPMAASPATLVASGPASQPQASLGVPPIGTSALVFAVVSFAAPLLVVLPFALPQIARGGTAATFGLLFLAFFGLAFAVPGLRRTVRLVRRARERGASAVRLRVGPDGVWTRDGGLVAWKDVRDIRTERAGRATSLGGPSVERWRLVIVPQSPGSPLGSASSDELDAPFDDVLELVRFYHAVTEKS